MMGSVRLQFDIYVFNVTYKHTIIIIRIIVIRKGGMINDKYILMLPKIYISYSI